MRRIHAAIVALLAIVLLAGCTSAPATGTVAQLYDAEDGKGVFVGQFEATADGEQFGLLFAKGNPLVTCVNKALAALSDSGELKAIQDQWLAGDTAPYFQQ